MQTPNKKRFYSPPFSALAAVSVRRLAWSMGKPMPAAVDLMVSLLPSVLDPAKVCLACKDSSKCELCVFCQQPAALPAALAV
jgi:recombinational DNA repair protein RecR